MGIQLQKVQIGYLYMLLATHVITCRLHVKQAHRKPIRIENFAKDMIIIIFIIISIIITFIITITITVKMPEAFRLNND